MKMETLTGNRVKDKKAKVLQDSLIRIADLVNFEGPLLTLFEHQANKSLYLLDWVDRDANRNRWLIYRCDAATISAFIRKEISHYDLFVACISEYYIVDIDKYIVWNNLQKIDKSDLPPSYFPNKNAFFDEDDCPNLTKLCEFLNQLKNSKKQRNSFLDYERADRNNLVVKKMRIFYSDSVRKSSPVSFYIKTAKNIQEQQTHVHLVNQSHFNNISKDNYNNKLQNVSTNS